MYPRSLLQDLSQEFSIFPDRIPVGFYPWSRSDLGRAYSRIAEASTSFPVPPEGPDSGRRVSPSAVSDPSGEARSGAHHHAPLCPSTHPASTAQRPCEPRGSLVAKLWGTLPYQRSFSGRRLRLLAQRSNFAGVQRQEHSNDSRRRSVHFKHADQLVVAVLQSRSITNAWTLILRAGGIGTRDVYRKHHAFHGRLLYVIIHVNSQGAIREQSSRGASPDAACTKTPLRSHFRSTSIV